MRYGDGGCGCGGCGTCHARQAASMAGFGAAHFGGTPPPSYILDMLYESLVPLRSRLSEVWAQAYISIAPDSSKGAWLSSLTQASNMIERATINGEAGQKLAMGDLTVAQWSSGPENAADLVEYVGQQAGMATVSYTVQRLWREVVVPTVEQVGSGLAKLPGQVTTYGPWVVAGLLGLVLLIKLK